ncbi:hypothetical protein O181_063982 [Austropuccinia psidii MF-1]|uniref:Uncharacterized protein n=1 Tax=Austropuccinia psidii MF-1 TaxID=1389203 RepID=A0A9Q3EUW9_9BASI|nr:hypothetical protein [Austropuccinia psidii MF-1]
MGPLKAQQIWAQGVSNGPHDPRTSDCSMWPMAHGPWTIGPQNGPKNPMKPNNQAITREGPRPKRDPNPKIEALSGTMGTRPPLRTSKREFQLRQ